MLKQTTELNDGFSERLRLLIGVGSVSAFARKVALSESLIRKYLKGSEPSLARADQIARFANVSLEWLATGCGYMYRQAELVDELAAHLASQLVAEAKLQTTEQQHLVLIIAVYQYLRTHKKPDGYLDEAGARLFLKHMLMG